ncbi:ABC transporter permease [Streptomyces sp. NBC_01136]|uniref:ABC transporter permease n=1 Tax=unclassified Streptomyces TaxID=2593676 RepID=UPI0032490D66|nr:ABC transporter permease [Streptomyces sp. NBC_01136]
MSWAKDLSMGVRFAVTGGREGWARVLLTAIGVGLGVALLLLTAAIPNMLQVRHDRESARTDLAYSDSGTPKAENTLLVANLDTTYRDKDVRGRGLEPEGVKAPLPPGVTKFPAPGEMLVSPALDRLLKSDGGKLLRERLPYRTVGTIGERGLVGSHELAFVAGAQKLAPQVDGARVARIDKYGAPSTPSERWDPVLLLLVLVVFVVLLMPVGVFIAAAVRFGGERRDRRLAALRLVGADSGMTRRIAAGEALAGALLGLVLGAGFFMIGRQVAGSVEILDISVFPSYLNPSLALAALVAVAVPAAAVAVTLLAMRGVVIEPLGVVRTARPPRRRLWWRLLLPLGGLAMLYPMIGQGNSNGNFNQYMVTAGVVLLLVGITALLPWVVETVVARLGSGSVSWQLAVRRLQLSSGTAARMVNGIAVAVAGAIALQMLFAGTSGAYTRSTGQDVSRVQISVDLPYGASLADADRQLARTKGVRRTTAFSSVSLGERSKDAELNTTLTVGDCAALREMAKLPSCREGDVFTTQSADDPDTSKLSEPGRTVYLDPVYTGGFKHRATVWTVPQGIKKAGTRVHVTGMERDGILATPSALPAEAAAAVRGEVYLNLDQSVPDVLDLVRNTMAKIDPLARDSQWFVSTESRRYSSIRTGLFVGATCVLALIGASLLVSQLEQLRERKKLLSALVAFGTRRRTLSLSVLWQTAVPVGIGLVLAAAVGLTLGAVLLKMADTPVTVDWLSVLSMTGIGALVVLVVTLLSLPPLVRMMRPEGLRTE